MIQRLGITSVDPDLLAGILASAAASPSARGHNIGGWRSANDFVSWPSAVGTISQIEAAVGSRILQVWAVVHREGSFHDWHTHAGSVRSGICYLTASDAATVLRDAQGERRVVPEIGLMVVFPGNLAHRSEPQHGPDPRVTIAFNLRAMS